MPWVRFDDSYPQHPKVVQLTDRLFRIHTLCIFWSARHLTDGVIRARLLGETGARPRPRRAEADRLVAAGLWHAADDPPCPSETCPHQEKRPDGWAIHDYFAYQPSREAVERARRDRAERQRRWRERRRASNASTRDGRNASVDASRNEGVDASRNAFVDAAPSRPVPSRPEGVRDGTGKPVPSPTPSGDRPPPPATGTAAGGRHNAPRCRTCGNRVDHPYHRNVCARQEAT